MLITQTITYLVAVFAAAGAIDRILGNRFGLGDKFVQAFHTMGPLALSMAGMLVIAPVIADLIGPVMTPFFRLIGADPAVFAGMFMGTDMGAAPLAQALALDPRSARLSGFVISSMMGATIVFHIPVAMEIAGKDRQFIARGMIAGLITIPLGCLAGGLAAGFPVSLVLHDLLPVAVVSLLLVVGMVRFREAMVKGFLWLGMFTQAVATFGLLLGILQSLTGFAPIKGIAPISEAFGVAAMTLAFFMAGGRSRA
ncbi:MAG: ethanolamine utilization protein EutH [Firmicutes bacterium]|nr:ethanolamine utilization protein EutH [Bacillota bacterium]